MNTNLAIKDSGSQSDVVLPLRVGRSRTKALARSVTLNSVMESTLDRTKLLQRSSSTQIRKSPKPYDRPDWSIAGRTIYTQYCFSMPASPIIIPTPTSIEDTKGYHLIFELGSEQSPISISSSPRSSSRSPITSRTGSPTRIPSRKQNNVTSDSDSVSTAPTTPISPTFSAVSAASSQTSIASIASVLTEKTTTGYFDRRP